MRAVPPHESPATPPVGRDAGHGLELLDPIVLHALRESGAYAVGVYLLPPRTDPERGLLRLALIAGFPRAIAAPWERVALDARFPVTDALRERRLVWLGVGEIPRLYPRAALTLPYAFAQASAPLHTGDTDWGGLLLLWSGSHGPHLAEHERQAVETACRRLGAVLRESAAAGRPVLAGDAPRVLRPPRERTVGYAEAVAAVDYADRLPEGGVSLDPEGHFTFVSAAARELLGAQSSELLGALPWEVLPWLRDPVFEDRYRAATISRHPVSFTALRPPATWLTFRLYPDATGLSVRITPADPPAGVDLTHPGRPLPPGRDRAPRPPRETTAGMPLRAGALYQLVHLAATLTEAVSVQDVTEMVAGQILPAFHAQALSLSLVDGGRMRIVGSHGYPPHVVERFDGRPLNGPAHPLTADEPDFFGSEEELVRAYPDLDQRDHMAAWAFLPLLASGRLVGMCALAWDRPHPFTPNERAALTSVAGLVAQAMDRARLYDTKANLAQSLQAGLLPRTLPDIPGLRVAARYRPATRGIDIGGDFYDVIRLDATTVAAVIGDVQGHNVTAAALMGQVRTAVHANATAGAPPGEVLRHTNRLLTDLDPGLFTSCTYVQIDLARRRLRLATAGHAPPLLALPGSPARALDVPPGLLLGIDPDARYTTVDAQLPPGTLLALFTDGLVETPGTDLDHSTELVGRLLTRHGDGPLDELADALLAHAARQHHGEPQPDDIALLLLRTLER